MAEPSGLTAMIVEDDPAIRDLVALHLGLDGFDCRAHSNGHEALDVLDRVPVDLIVLDVMVPGVDGVGVCRALRRGRGPNADTPILMLTARREESDKVLGLESGADDYLTKPFSVRELVARARALIRRRHGTPSTGAPQRKGIVRVRDLELDRDKRAVSVDGRAVDLTRQEFNLLFLLASHPGIVFDRATIVARAWHDDVTVTDRSVDTIVKRVRRKIEADPANPGYLVTVWGSGYKVVDG
jgi:two-component system OmpR family response regulator/two-component system alkaline phosphatase synthesis response regulator PhoP